MARLFWCLQIPKQAFLLPLADAGRISFVVDVEQAHRLLAFIGQHYGFKMRDNPGTATFALSFTTNSQPDFVGILP